MEARRRALQDALCVSAFCTSQEAFAAEDLFSAYRSGAADEVRAAAAKPLFKTIDISVSPKPQALSACRQLRPPP